MSRPRVGRDTITERDLPIPEAFPVKHFGAAIGPPFHLFIIVLPVYSAGSTGRRNTFSLTGLQALVQSFGGSSPSEGLAGPCIERVSNNCEYVRTVCAQIGSFREVLSKQSIGVLVRSALVITVRRRS